MLGLTFYLSNWAKLKLLALTSVPGSGRRIQGRESKLIFVVTVQLEVCVLFLVSHCNGHFIRMQWKFHQKDNIPRFKNM